MIPEISRLSFTDYSLFKTAMRQQPLQYAYSWLYVLRAAHFEGGKMGYKFVSDDLLAVIGFRHNHIHITPLYDATNGAHLQKLCLLINKLTHCPIIIKKFYPQKLEHVSYQIVHDPLLLEDDTCPETDLDLSRLLAGPHQTLSSTARKLGRRARSFEPQSKDFKVIASLKQVSLEQLELFLSHDTRKYDSYIHILRFLYEHGSDLRQYRVMVFTREGVVRGLYMGELLSMNHLGLYGGITTKDVGGITEWMDMRFFRSLNEDGIRFVHLGGAENKGIAQYITKLNPYRLTGMQAVLFDPPRQKKPALIVRPVQQSDLHTLASIYAHVFNTLVDLSESWTHETAYKLVAHFYRRQPDLFFLAQQNNKVIGAVVAAVQPWWDGNHLVEGEIFIDLNYSSEWLSKRLLKELLRQTQDRYQAVAWDTITPTTNLHPLAVYKKIGFEAAPYWTAVTGDIPTVLKRLDV